MTSPTSGQTRIRVLLFDIGGVCVVSPFQAILDYEQAHKIPHNWTNFAISRSGRRGAWQRLERGEIALDEPHFFAPFRRDLHDPRVWAEYWDIYVQRLRNGNDAEKQLAATLPPRTASPPDVDTTALFWAMMAAARYPDPFMYPTLRYLRAKHPEFVLGALSNTVAFPPDHPYSQPQRPEQNPRSWFDVFVSSSDVGLRKPEREIYELALREVGACVRKKGGGDLRPQEVLFLDDIGENCKMGGKVGMQVIRVVLGRSQDAVKELGRRVFGLDDLVDRVKAWEMEMQEEKSRL